MEDGIGRMSHIVVDCRDPTELAVFWSALLGTALEVSDPDWTTVGYGALGVCLAFQQVPEPKRVKNRLHLDIEVHDYAKRSLAVSLSEPR